MSDAMVAALRVDFARRIHEHIDDPVAARVMDMFDWAVMSLPDGAGDGLRAAANKAIDYLDPDFGVGPPQPAAALATLRSARAALATPPSDSLDVERLARALHDTDMTARAGTRAGKSRPDWLERETASIIAAAYLAAAPRSEG